MSLKVGVVGAGYVGLTAAVCFAHLGHDVIVADIDAERVAALTRGEVPIHEPGLDELLAAGLASGRLRPLVGAAAAADADLVCLCVPTAVDADGCPDLSHVEAVVAELAPVLRPGAVLVTKSTLPVGGAALVARLLARPDVRVVSNPEFLREGAAVRDFLQPSRIVVGGDDEAAVDLVVRLHAGLEAPVVRTDAASAELAKLAANAFLATKISFANALAGLASAVGADVVDVVAALALDPRIGADGLRPGPGWGGSCLPKDVRALVWNATAVHEPHELLDAVLSVNARQRDRVIALVEAAAGPVGGAVVAVWGLAFKAGTDDLRESPALAVIDGLVQRGATVRAFDPAVRRLPPGRIAAGSVVVVGDPYDACDGAAVLVVLTEWPAFARADPEEIARRLAARHVVDARNVLDPQPVRAAGLHYTGLGRR